MVRTEHPNALWFIGSTAACTLIGILSCLAVKTWVAMYTPAPGAWLAAICVTFLPAYLVNKKLTNSFRNIHFQDAPEWRSFFGAWGLIGSLVLVSLWLGTGLTGTVAVEEACRQLGSPLGLLHSVEGTVHDTYPRSVADRSRIWVPAIGSGERKRVIVRNAYGTLKAQPLPRYGKVIEGAVPARVGWVNDKRVSLYPLAERASKPSLTPVAADEPDSCSSGQRNSKSTPSVVINGPGGSLVIY